MGFGDVIEEKTKALNTHYRKLVWKYFKEFFKLPKIIVALFLIWITYFSLENISDRLWIVIPAISILTIIPIWFLVTQSKRIKQIKNKTGKKRLFDNVSMQLEGVVYSINIIIQILIFYNGAWSSKINLIFSAIIILFGLTIFISIFIVSPKLRKEMATQHPDYKFA